MDMSPISERYTAFCYPTLCAQTLPNTVTFALTTIQYDASLRMVLITPDRRNLTTVMRISSGLYDRAVLQKSKWMSVKCSSHSSGSVPR